MNPDQQYPQFQQPQQPSPQQPSPQFSYAQAPPPPPQRKSKKLRDNISTIVILISAPLLAILLSLFVFRTYQVDGPSMLTTLHDKDRLIINKVPVTFSKVTGRHYIPNRYDIIVFDHKGVFSGSTNEKQIIKRVIGLPGERVVINNKQVTVFNSQHPDGYLVDSEGPESKVIPETNGNVDVTVPKNEVFVMGDNRVNSLDSRELGTIRSQDIIGKLVLRIYPFSTWESF